MMVLSDVNMAPEMIKKLTRLYTLLKRGKKSYERIALKSRDKQLQQTIFGLAQESNQYASEVFAQIYCLGGSWDYPEEENETDAIEAKMGKTESIDEETDEENISEACEISENSVIAFYKELQKEHLLLIDELQRMIKYQMEGFLYSIEQLKLLKTSIQ